jgi:hypothetical protein
MRKLLLHLLLASSFFAPLAARPAKASELTDIGKLAVGLATATCHVDRLGITPAAAAQWLSSQFGTGTASAALADPAMMRRSWSVYKHLNSRCQINDYGAQQVLRENPDF